MNPADRARLTTALRQHVAKIAVDLRVKMRAPGEARDRARQLHADEQVAEDFDLWTDLLARRAAVLWVLKSVYVRVLEDRRLLTPGRLLDPEAQQLFEKLAPNLGETAFLRWVYHDLASPRGGLPELFSPQPAEVALPSNELSRALIAFWRHRDADTGESWSFAEERFEGELMGDLYQELDPLVKERFALCQTPDFVRSFILDRTLTPAIEEFGADQVRLLDPACGSGHFLIDGLKRLFAATSAQHPGWPRGRVAAHALERVVGIDLNDYACALARTRLLMTAAELAGVDSLEEAAKFHPHVYWADGLEQVEREDTPKTLQMGLFKTEEERPRASLTRPEVRAALKKVLEPRFQAVVANPPYITERDPARKEYHREKTGKTSRYVSAYREYSLGSLFTERCFQLSVEQGFVGLITSNNFMKREFGKPLIEKVLSGIDLTMVVDTSQAYIPFHGTPTVLLFARNRLPVGETVRAVMGKRGETEVPAEPAKGRVWSSIVEGWAHVGFSSEFVSVADVPRTTFGKHPWSLGGGGAAELRGYLESISTKRLEHVVDSIGFVAITGTDEVFLQAPAFLERVGISHRKPMVTGDVLRDWALTPELDAVWPHDDVGVVLPQSDIQDVLSFFWPYRSCLRDRKVFGRPIEERGIKWWEVREVYRDRFHTPLSIAFAFVATHNHFVLDRGGKVFNRSAPVVKLPAKATKGEHLSLLGLLNSSLACFWMKQVFHNKGLRGQGGGITASDWEQFFEFDATKLRLFPVANQAAGTEPYARELDAVAHERAARTVTALLDNPEAWRDARSLRTALEKRRARDLEDLFRLVALQEELDWLCYRLYGLEEELEIMSPDAIEPLMPTWLPWVMNLAERDAEVRAQIDRGEDPGELPTEWFSRHRWQPVTALPKEASPALHERVKRRRDLIRAVPAIALIEGPAYKRRWYRPDYAEEERQALELWLAERIEVAARERDRTFSLDQMVAALQDDARVLAVCEVLAGRRDFSLSQLVGATLQAAAVPNHRLHVYKDSGLEKRAAWERTWDAQRREDAGEKVTPAVPPPYTQADFLKPGYFRLRGKLDVPKERFIAFTEVPGLAGTGVLYGWAGWTPLQRLKALVSLDAELEDAGVPLTDRAGLLDSAWRLLPDVAREDASAAARFKAELQALVGASGPSSELVEGWRRSSPPHRARMKKTRRSVASVEEGNDAEEEPIGAKQIVPLRSAQITNFRGIRSATLPLHPRVTVLFGANAAGKTTVLDALAIALGALVSRVPKAVGRDFATTGDIRVPWKSRPAVEEKKGVECPYARIEIITASGVLWDVTRFRSVHDKELVPEGVGTKALHEAFDPLVLEALDAAPGTPTRPIPLVASYRNERASIDIPQREGTFERDTPRLLGFDSSLSAKTRFKAVFEWFRVAEDEERRERERRKDFNFRLPALEWVRRAVERAELRCLNPRLETRPLRMLVDFDHGNGEYEPLDINALSDGYRTHFSLVVDLARRMVQLNPSSSLEDPERGTNTRAVVLIDEVDLHLDPPWQGRVVRGLLAAFPNTQFVVTTHSEQVLGSVEVECVRKLTWGEGEVLIEKVPFAQGATGERILIDLMGAPERVQGPVTDKLQEYLRLVGAGSGHGEDAKKLRGQLEAALQRDPMLHRADLEMQRQELMAKFGGKTK